MYKVLLADDELLVRNYLRTLIEWVKHGLVICGEATNGHSAVQLIQETAPDIVILDINMPGMDGVALSKYIQAKHPEIKMIVLSSYDKFEYVRETLNAGAVDYLLKHALDGEGLLRVLTKAKQELDQEVAASEKQKHFEQNWKVISQTLARNYLKDLVLGSEDRLAAIEDHFRNELSFRTGNMMLVVMQVVNYTLMTEEYTDKEKNTFIRSIHDLSRQIAGSDGTGITAHIDQGKFVFLLSFQNRRSESVMQQEADSFMRRLEKSLYTYFNIHVVFGTSPVCHHFNQVHNMYKYACDSLEERMVSHYYGGLDRSKAKSAIQDKAALTIEQEKELLAALEHLNRAKAETIIESIFSMLRDKQAGLSSIQSIVGELLHIANRVWRKSGLHAQNGEDEIDPAAVSQTQLTELKDLQEIQGWVKHRYGRLIEQLSGLQGAGYSPYVKQAIQYVREHYASNLSLDTAAANAGITSAYLGKLFKEETGMSFTEYVNRLRVEISKQLILKGSKIKNIYSQVGFSSYNYFFKVFKDLENMTPQTYAKRE